MVGAPRTLGPSLRLGVILIGLVIGAGCSSPDRVFGGGGGAGGTDGLGGQQATSSTGCGEVEVRCADGEDNDCDGLTDCQDPDCGGQACNDNNNCTEHDKCGLDGGHCRGEPIACDDDNACTDNTCDPDTGECVFVPNSAPCDDGLFCNGADRCVSGACAEHDGSSCGVYCNETLGSCEECQSDADCGTPPPPSWSDCVFSSACATSGQQEGTATSLACVSGKCTTTVTHPSRACSRPSRDGVQCGTGTRSRCCSGGCVDTWADAKNCGGCGRACAWGLGCKIATQGGGAECFECQYNTQCGGDRDVMTCYAKSVGGHGYCRCQTDEACAPGQKCKSGGLSGDSYCYYP